ncbi:MAG: class I SAM-dependent methyltransferase [Anaerolineae bacterium]
MYDAERIQHMKAGVGSMFSRSARTYDQVGYLLQLSGTASGRTGAYPSGRSGAGCRGRTGAVLFPAAERAGAQGQVIGMTWPRRWSTRPRLKSSGGTTNVEIYQMDAEDLSFPDAMFDVVLCGFGVSFFPQRAKACSELRRVLKQAAGWPSPPGDSGTTDGWAWMREMQLISPFPGEPLQPRPRSL